MRKYLTTFILLFSVSFGEDYAGLSGSFLRVGMTARSIAMGGAFTAEKEGALSVTAIATHPVLSGKAIARLQEAPISKVIVCNTIDIPKNKIIDKLEVVSIAEVFGESMKRIVEGASLSSLFKGFN